MTLVGIERYKTQPLSEGGVARDEDLEKYNHDSIHRNLQN